MNLQYWKKLLINVPSCISSKKYDHRHAYLLEDTASFQKQSGVTDSALPPVPSKLDKTPLFFRECTFYLEIYTIHTNTNCGVVAFLKKLYSTRLVELKVGFCKLPVNLKVDVAFTYLLEIVVEATVDTQATIKLQKATYILEYSSNANGPTIFFQKMAHLPYQSGQASINKTLKRLASMENTIMTNALAAFQKCEHIQQSIDFIKAA